MRINELREDAAAALVGKQVIIIPRFLDLAVLHHEDLVDLWQILDCVSDKHDGLSRENLADNLRPDVGTNVSVDS